MADEELQARLESHSKAFEGLMSLIPAKFYYGQDNDDQWQRKKQTKEQKRAAKKAKLDPSSNKSALDVQKENEHKRKRELEGDNEVDLSEDGVEQPREGLKALKKATKKQKLNDGVAVKAAEDKPIDEAERAAIAEKRRQRRERRKARNNKIKEKKQKKEKKEETDGALMSTTTETAKVAQSESKPKAKAAKPKATEKKAPEVEVAEGVSFDGLDVDGIEDSDSEDEEEQPAEGSEASDDDAEDDKVPEPNDIRMDGIEDDVESSSSADSTPGDLSPTFDSLADQDQSSASSITSIPPPTSSAASKTGLTTTTTTTKTPSTTLRPPIKLPQLSPELLQSRLQARHTALRALRKPHAHDGTPAKNRQELIEARRRKQEARKAHKKELRLKVKQSEIENGSGAVADAEAEAARLRGGSGSPMWSPGAFSPVAETNSFSFGRVAFEDGAEMDASLTALSDPRKKKGPRDIKTALLALSTKAQRMSSLDAVKRADIEEKDRWLNAKKRISGAKVRDDTSLLKKTLKRKEKGKAKSEKEWGERLEGVVKGKEMKQKRREGNLAKRKEDSKKGKKSHKVGGGHVKSKGKGKASAGGPKKRPGFEGTFKSGGGRK